MQSNIIAAIRKEFRRSPEARYIHRLHAVLLVLGGLSALQVGKRLHIPGRSVAHWARAFDKNGLDGLIEAKKEGRPSVLAASQKRTLKNAFGKPPKHFGLQGETWTGELVRQFLSKRFRIKLTMRHCRRLLRQLENETSS